MTGKAMRSAIVCYGGGLLLAMAGCTAGPSDTDFFAVGPRAIDEMAHAQAAAGARDDATLYPQHFDGVAVNSLGRRKLDLMWSLQPSPRWLYLDLPPDDPQTEGRRESVQHYLQEHGIAITAVELREGANPEVGAPAVSGLGRIDRTESLPARRLEP